jgi:hypothetical protein
MPSLAFCCCAADGWNGSKAAADAPPPVKASVAKPTAAPNVTRLKFFMIESPISIPSPPLQIYFRWWFNEKDGQEFQIRCTRNCVDHFEFAMEHTGGE